MLIKELTIRDMLAITHVALAFPTPLTLIAGDNGAGKSSLCEAIRLALLGELSRGLRHKKDMAALVRDGAKKGGIEIAGEDWITSTTLPAGTVKGNGAVPRGDALACCLTPDTYARMAPNDRKAFTLELLGVHLSADIIAARMKARDLDAVKVETVKPLIDRRGYAAGAEFATERAAQARGAWKSTTGEDYGAKKAEGWLPTVPTPPEGTVNGLQQQIESTDQQIADLNQAIGAANAHASTIDGLSRRIAEATEIAKLFARRTSAVQAAEQALTEAREKLAAAQEKAAGGTIPQNWPCPDCGSVLMHRAADGALVHLEKPDTIADPQWKAALPSLLEAVKLMETALANAGRDLKESSEAATLKASLEDQLAAVPKEGVSVDVGGMRTQIAALQDIRRTLLTHQQRIRDAEAARLNAEQTRDLAAAAHKDVEQWVAIADALQPDGIPGEILAEGIEPLNLALQDLHKAMVEIRADVWPLVQIAPDMSITYGGRLYALCSESEKYRADVMLAATIARFSQLDLILLDRVDVLAPKGRIALILLLTKLAAGENPLQVIAAGTFKAPPKGLPSSWSQHWITRGALDTAATEAEAA